MPVVSCLGYEVLQCGIIVQYRFCSVQRRASFALEEGVCRMLHTAKFRGFLSLLHLLAVQEVGLCLQKEQVLIKHSCALPHESVILLCLSRKRSRNSFFQWVLLDLLINVYHLFPRRSFPPPYLLTEILQSGSHSM